jgi:dTDP-glucose 4,6-dehydratase
MDDPKQRRPDITRAKEILNWEPKVARKEGLSITYDYFKSLPPEEWARQPKEFVSRN